MPNHFHLLLQSDRGQLSSFMHCLLTGYSKYFNDRHERVGHLFQNRYKSPVVAHPGYLRALVRYIHRNPVRSGIVPSIEALQDYFWTGHRRIVHGGDPQWQDTELLEAEFHDSAANNGWIANYREFMQTEVDALVSFSASERTADSRQLGPISSARVGGPHDLFASLVEQVPAQYGISAEQALSGDRSYLAIKVRRAIVVTCKSMTGVSVAELARWMRMKESSVRYLLNSGRKRDSYGPKSVPPLRDF
jgi:Transposase IS200 like